MPRITVHGGPMIHTAEPGEIGYWDQSPQEPVKAAKEPEAAVADVEPLPEEDQAD